MKTNRLFGMMILLAGIMLVFGFTACDNGTGGGNSSNDDNLGSGSGSGSGNGNGGKSLAGTYTRNSNSYIIYTLEFTNTTYSLKTGGEAAMLSGSYKYGGTTLTLNMNGVDIEGSASLSGSSLTLSGFGTFAGFFDGTWTRQ